MLGPLASGAEKKAADLPPPPGTLARELEHSGAGAPRAAVSPVGGDPALGRPIEIPFVLEGGHIIVEASINGGPLLPFLFDTGAGTTLTEDTAQGLRTSAKRSLQVGGVGRKRLSARTIEVDRITIGAATFEHHTVTVHDFRNIIVDRGSRARLAGFIGSELLMRFAVTIDFKQRLLTFNALGFRPPSSQFALPLGMSISPEGLSLPSVQAEVDGVAGEFVLDTGSTGEVFVSRAFQRSRAFGGRGKSFRFLGAGGIGGPAHVSLGFGERLRLGPLSLSPPMIMGSMDEAGFAVPPSIAGLIGYGVLRLFVVTIDYQAGRVYFERIAGRELPTAFRSAGMMLDKPDHDAFEILDVLAGSAAERAGLRRGDLIVEVGGRSARDLGISDLSVRDSEETLLVTTSDRRSYDLAIEKLLP
ncbi:aspartyl protease family protein [Methylosinus trichosporium]|uniref:aspartyl protease family protein n=1 Tax=Methylosinus trichosporium TaxID=426 RepID=UPI0018E43BD6|nr:aspartyl protease family protein [Methylosinus trichosporium]